MPRKSSVTRFLTWSKGRATLAFREDFREPALRRKGAGLLRPLVGIDPAGRLFRGMDRTEDLREAEVVELVFAFGDDLVGVDPDVAPAGQHIDVGFGFPVGVGLAAIRVPKRNVHAGKLLVLEQDADHFRKAEVGAEGQLADAVAVFVGVAVVPEFLLQILAVAMDFDQARIRNLQGERCGLQIAIFAVEVVAGGGIADKGAVDGRGRRENLAGRKIGPIARTDQAAGLDPVKPAVEVRGDGCARRRF